MLGKAALGGEERLALKLSERHGGTEKIKAEWLKFLTVNFFPTFKIGDSSQGTLV